MSGRDTFLSEVDQPETARFLLTENVGELGVPLADQRGVSDCPLSGRGS